MSNVDEQIKASDQTLKVQASWDDRVVKFAKLQMEIQTHAMEMRGKEIENRTNIEKFLALRHARITLEREAKRFAVKVNKAEKKAAAIEKDQAMFNDLLSPGKIRTRRIGRHWSSLAKYIARKRLLFPSTGGRDVFKKSISNPNFPIRTEDFTAGEFVSFCRYNALLVKPKTSTFEILTELIDFAESEANNQIESLAESVSNATDSLNAILQSHWKTQSV